MSADRRGREGDVARTGDVVVVGAGIVGCAIASELARRGAHVLVLDVRDVGMGATRASAGVLAPYIESHFSSPLRALGARSLELYDEFVARTVEVSGVPVQYARTGTLELAADEALLERLQDAAIQQMAAGVSCEFVDGATAKEMEPQLAADILGALLVPAHGFVVANELTAALSRAAAVRGARISPAQAVRAIAAEGRDVRVETDRERISASSVVLAAGSWSGQLQVTGAPVLPVRPVRGQLLSLLWSGPRFSRVIWSPRCYLVPWDDGTLLVGATVEEAGFDERATVAGVHDLLAAACDIAPHAWQAGFGEVRVGLRPATPDELPVVGASRHVKGLVYATGHYRNGVLLAPLTAGLVAELVLEGRSDPLLDLMTPARYGA